jgi:hypothetical protein
MEKIDNILKDYLKIKGGNNEQPSKEQKINNLIDKITGKGEIKKIVGIKLIEDSVDNQLVNESQLKEYLDNLHKSEKKTNPVVNQFYSSSEKEF